jgi:hypothetical protein
MNRNREKEYRNKMNFKKNWLNKNRQQGTGKICLKKFIKYFLFFYRLFYKITIIYLYKIRFTEREELQVYRDLHTTHI